MQQISADAVLQAVPHKKQYYSWDCGLACASMVLHFSGLGMSDVYADLPKIECEESIWTIDLARLLRLYNVPCKFCTVTTHADPSYGQKGFYLSHFDNDEKRVNKLFQQAEVLGISVEKRSVSLDEFMKHLSLGGIAVCLLDWSYLKCIWCTNKVCTTLGCFFSCIKSYQGHFVVICGYNPTDHCLYFKNPASSDELCCICPEDFEKARKSHGTDEDILFIYKDPT